MDLVCSKMDYARFLNASFSAFVYVTNFAIYLERINKYRYTRRSQQVQGDQKVSVHLMIKIQKVNWLRLTAWQSTAKAHTNAISYP
jgi:hypothetical protein